MTGLISYEVRGKNWQIITPPELKKDRPYFESAPLVETGCDYPFYDDYMAGLGTFANSHEARLCVQDSLVGHVATSCGNKSLLQTLWAQIGTFPNHQTLLSLFDWGQVYGLHFHRFI